MNDVNANSPGLKLVTENGRPAARVSASSQAEGSSAATGVKPVSSQPQSVAAAEVSQKESQKADNQAQAKELTEKVSQLNDYVQSLHRNLEFQVDNTTGQTVVKVVDQETDKVIRQIPDELALRLAEKLQQDEPLTLLNIEV